MTWVSKVVFDPDRSGLQSCNLDRETIMTTIHTVTPPLNINTGAIALEANIVHQREQLAGLLAQPLLRVAQQCGQVWPQRDALNKILASALHELPFQVGGS